MAEAAPIKTVEVLIVGASLSGAACAKRLVDAGVETLVLERKKLPRHKVCSGILSPRGHRFLIENFGPLPRQVLHEPTYCRGVTFHFPSRLALSMNFEGGPTPHLHRKYSDDWAISQSGVEVQAECSVTRIEDRDDHVAVYASQDGRPVVYHARHVVGADGPVSRVRQQLYPSYPGREPWFMVGQMFHAIKQCPLSEEYFHFWFHPDLGYYTWSHARNGEQIIGVGFLNGENFVAAHVKAQNYLEEKHGVYLEPANKRESLVEIFGPSLLNRYVFGKGRTLITGQAAGFLNMIAEGMSCALHSGAIAGESIIEARQGQRPIQDVYRKMIASEVQRCSDQWNPLKIAFGRPHEADFRAALRKLPRRDRLKLVGEIMRYIRVYGKFKWGRQILGQALRRQLWGKYNPKRWV